MRNILFINKKKEKESKLEEREREEKCHIIIIIKNCIQWQNVLNAVLACYFVIVAVAAVYYCICHALYILNFQMHIAYILTAGTYTEQTHIAHY